MFHLSDEVTPGVSIIWIVGLDIQKKAKDTVLFKFDTKSYGGLVSCKYAYTSSDNTANLRTEILT